MASSSPATTAVLALDLVYLARLREAFGRGSEKLMLDVPHGQTAPSVADVLRVLAGRGGAFAQELAPGRAVRVAINHDVVTPEHPVRDGDEIALFPPVTGG